MERVVERQHFEYGLAIAMEFTIEVVEYRVLQGGEPSFFVRLTKRVHDDVSVVEVPLPRVNGATRERAQIARAMARVFGDPLVYEQAARAMARAQDGV